MTDHDDQTPTRADFRRAAALFLHRRHHDHAGVNTILADADNRQRCSALVLATIDELADDNVMIDVRTAKRLRSEAQKLRHRLRESEANRQAAEDARAGDLARLANLERRAVEDRRRGHAGRPGGSVVAHHRGAATGMGRSAVRRSDSGRGPRRRASDHREPATLAHAEPHHRRPINRSRR